MSTAPASIDLDPDRRLLRAAVEEAGALALSHFRRHAKRWQKGPGQIVTEVDLAIDDLLYRRLLDARPGDGWLSEERADDGSRHQRRRVWIVDPIDGTRAFVDGRAEFAISAALVVGHAPVLGVVSNPATGEWFEAMAGGGAWLDGQSIRVSDRTEVNGARLLASRTEMRHRRWSELIAGPRFTLVSSLAYKLARVAAGRDDGLLSLRPLHDWDVAAALLLMREAGGLATTADGSEIELNGPMPRHEGLIAAGTATLHRTLEERLVELRG